MLNRKGQVGDAIEMVIAIILLIGGFALISGLDTAYSFSVDNAKGSLIGYVSGVEAVDTQFLGTDLLNVARLEVDEEYTIGELLGYAAKNKEEIKDPFLEDYMSVYTDNPLAGNFLICEGNMKAELDELLVPVYGDDWFINVKDEEGATLFLCSNLDSVYFLDFATDLSSELTIPSIEDDNLIVSMGVFV